ncbi:response regulator [Thermodesulfobacteriota bacterium]
MPLKNANSDHGKEQRLLKSKRILVVDDEPDVLETVRDILDMCQIETAGNFERAEELLRRETYDMVILDVMGVKGIDLLEMATEQGFPAVMLTAPALDPQYILEAMKRSAISYLPKEDLAHLDNLIAELFQIIQKGGSCWAHTMKRLEPLLNERFDSDWKERYSELWQSARIPESDE